MCVKILRRDIDKLGYNKDFSIYDEGDKDRALKSVIESLGLDNDKFLKTAKNLISEAKNECISPDEFKREYSHLFAIDELYKIYELYDEMLKSSNALDFDDLLYVTYKLFVKFPEVGDYYARRFSYIHIDEFQDTNRVQFAIVQRLASVNGNIFVVGDDDQSIYGWRGAKIENILKFDDIYRGAKIYKLEQNYRSTKKILNLANTIIENNKGRRPKKLWTENSEGVRVETFVGSDENNEASFVATSIKSIMARGGKQYKDFAVFMRVNAISRAFEQEFTKYNIPYRIYGGLRFFERKEIKDVLSYLKIINNPYDDQAFLRCIATPKRGIGDKTLQELKEFSASYNLPLYFGIDKIHLSTLSSSTKTKLINFKMMLDSFKEYSRLNDALKTMEYIIETTSFMDQFAEKNEENSGRIYNVNELKNTAALFIRDNPGSTLSDYLNSVTLSTDTDDINEDDAVTLATIHAVKGLEYDCVFVAGLDEKIMPISRAIDDDNELEEERRLMYVAVTRARERLYLTRAMSRYLYGRREYMTQSRFLKEGAIAISGISKEKAEIKSTYTPKSYNDDEIDVPSFNSGYSSSYAKSFLKNNVTPTAKKTEGNLSLKSGMKVKHPKFGVGTVIMVKGSGDNVIVDVAFVGVGIKSLAVKFAPLEIL
jgi:DNA helicase-2/ATP-dependent DNA helicase PcrA